VKTNEHRCNSCLRGLSPWICYTFQVLQ
jgi:hypothetical protein